jgi:hypothetical protein
MKLRYELDKLMQDKILEAVREATRVADARDDRSIAIQHLIHLSLDATDAVRGALLRLADEVEALKAAE